MEIKTAFIQRENLIIQRISGEWSIEDFKRDHEILLQQPYLDSIKVGIVDLRGVHINLNHDELSQLEQIRNALDRSIRAMIIVDQPSSTAFTLIYKNNLKDVPLGYCSTLEYAVKRLELETDAESLEVLIQEL